MTEAELELSVVIPCRNVEATLPEQMDALCEQVWEGSWEVVVVDNASEDRTAAIAAEYGGSSVSVRVVEATGGRGVAYARNEGVRNSSARSVAFCDGDDVVRPAWVQALGDSLRTAEIVTGGIDVWDLNPPWLAESRPGGRNSGAPMFGGVPFARGNNCGMHRSVWAELGGFDEDFRGLEDIEFSLRAVAGGFRVEFVPDAVVSYRFREEISDLWRQGTYYGLGRPELARQAREAGLPGPARLEGLRSWGWLVLKLPALRSRGGRRSWLWVLANRIGVLRGVVRSRTFHV